MAGTALPRITTTGDQSFAGGGGVHWKVGIKKAEGKTDTGFCGQSVNEATMFSTMRSAKAEIIKNGFTSSADRMITPA